MPYSVLYTHSIPLPVSCQAPGDNFSGYARTVRAPVRGLAATPGDEEARARRLSLSLVRSGARAPLNERHEGEPRVLLRVERAVGFFHLPEYRRRARVDEPAADFQLFAPRGRHLADFGRGDAAVEAADLPGNRGEPGRGVLAIKINPRCQGRILFNIRFPGRAAVRQEFDRIDPSPLADELGQKRGLPSGTVSDVHDALARLGSEEFEQ